MNFNKILTVWYSEHKRPMPWRGTKNPYFIWLSEIILQQTQVAQGLPYYEAFVAKYPSVFDLAKAEELDVLKLWQGLGYYSRARNLHTTAKYIADTYHGIFPNTYNELLKLKGVGDYTASAIASICFNEPEAVVDGNVYRVLSRYFGVDTPINTSAGAKTFKKLATLVMDTQNPAEYNQAIMEFGAIQCRPKNPNCSICPLSQSCFALQQNKIDTLPVKLGKTKVSTKYFNFLIILSEDQKTIFQKRTAKGIWQNLYQFPLLETPEKLKSADFKNHPFIKALFKDTPYKYSLYNKNVIVHKLSHQHLHVKFWIVSVPQLPKKGIPIDTLINYPTPIVLSNFIDEFFDL